MLKTTASIGKKWVLASHNHGKIKEFTTLLAPLGITVVPQVKLSIQEIHEPFHTFIENALSKARHAASISGLPAIADDSGICAPALDNAPGIYSSRFAATTAVPQSDDIMNNRKLNALLTEKEDKRVFYYCCLVFITNAQDPTPIVSEGRWWGIWHPQAKGENGFGYDPHFYLPEQNQTVASLDSKTKNRLSHRAKAFQTLIKKLNHL